MKKIELLTIGKELLKVMSKADIRLKDCDHIEMYNEYNRLRSAGAKYWYVISHLSEKYKVSESNIARIIRRLSGDVNV